MDLELTEEQKQVQQTARKLALETLSKDSRERDAEEKFPHNAWKKFAEAGFAGMMIPEEYGGSNMDTVSYVLAIKEISKVDASGGVILSVNNSLACYPIYTFGNEDQKKKYLVPLAKGEKLGAYALTEPNAGSDAANQQTTAIPDGNYFVLNGTKNFITNGMYADAYVVYTATDKSKKAKGITAFIVEKGTAGFSVGKKEKKLGIRSSDTVSLIFENCRVPKENILGEFNEGFKIAMSTLDGGRIGIAAQALGIAEAAYDSAVKYSKERKQFGKTISEFQATQFKLADMKIQIDAAMLLMLRAASKRDRGERYTLEASMAKLYASETAMRVTTEAVQIHGGYGYIKDFPVERFMRDAKITEIYEGTSEVQRLVISREILK
jgi:alkylation response protein AidB-like acyl-CoA dehydrogenase